MACQVGGRPVIQRPEAQALRRNKLRVLVQRRDRRLRASGRVGHLRVLEVEVVLQHEVVLFLESEDLVHRFEGACRVVGGKEPFHSEQMPVDHQFVRVRQALVRAEAREATVTTLLGHPRIGVIHLDRRGRILAVNDRAGSLLRSGRGVLDRDVVLRARVPADQRRLTRLVAEALPTSAAAPVSGSMVLSIPAFR